MIPLPMSIKKKLAGYPYYNSYYYAKIAATLYYRRLFKRDCRLQNSADDAPLLPDYANYETLFAASVANFKTIVAPYTAEFTWFMGRTGNSWFGSVEAELYYAMIRQFKPRLIIEIGSGHSTYFAADALKKNQQGHLMSIDPQPRRDLPKAVECIQARVEEVDPAIFTVLEANDILFIDSSHTTEEAKYHCQQILPDLKSGVIVHHHDFAYPYKVYFLNNPIKFGEYDVLLEFYNTGRDMFEILISASYVRFRHPELLNQLIKSYRWASLKIPLSLWTRRKPC